jgi:hypothetical protein
MTRRESIGASVIGVAMTAILLLLPSAAQAQCCQKLCNPDGSSTRCGNVINGLAMPVTGCIQVAPALQADPTKSGFCIGGTMLAGLGAPGPPVLLGCTCWEEFGCFDGKTANRLTNHECAEAAIANCGSNVVTQPSDPDCS